jgi:hypothetical protein
MLEAFFGERPPIPRFQERFKGFGAPMILEGQVGFDLPRCELLRMDRFSGIVLSKTPSDINRRSDIESVGIRFTLKDVDVLRGPPSLRYGAASAFADDTSPIAL